jgi:hypothetical protein
MSTSVISEHLAPPAAGEPHTYAVHTRTEIRVPGHQLTQTSTALLRLTVHQADPTGMMLEVATLALRPDAPTPQTALLTAIACQQTPLHVRTDAHGTPLRITNKATLAAQWQEALPGLLAHYGAQPGAAALLALIAPQYEEDNDQLAQGVVHQSAGGALLPSLYGLHSWQGDTRTTTKTVRQALGPVALPLHVSWTAAPAADVFAPTVEVEGVGRLDRVNFDEAASQAFLASLRGEAWTGPPAPLNVFWRAQYTVGRRGQGLLAGRQGLRVAVDKLYFADISHVVRPATSLPPA